MKEKDKDTTDKKDSEKKRRKERYGIWRGRMKNVRDRFMEERGREKRKIMKVEKWKLKKMHVRKRCKRRLERRNRREKEKENITRDRIAERKEELKLNSECKIRI